MARMLYPEAVGRELFNWRRFLPTSETVESYDFDVPPTEALEHIATAQELGIFTRIEIWTPVGNGFREHAADRLATLKANARESKDTALATAADFMQKIDPMAVGVITDLHGNDSFFPIARWGEALKSMAQIKRYVRRTQMWEALFFRVMPAAIVMIFLAAFLTAISTVGWAQALAGGAVGLIGLVVFWMMGVPSLIGVGNMKSEQQVSDGSQDSSAIAA